MRQKSSLSEDAAQDVRRFSKRRDVQRQHIAAE